MATNFNNAKLDSVGNTRTLLYTAPAATQSIIFGLFTSNIDTTNKLDHTVTIEIQDAALAYHMIADVVPVPYGSSLILDKPVTLLAGEKLYLTGDLAAVLSSYASILEKS